MEQAIAEITEQEKKDLKRYAQILKQYIDPKIRQYSPIGWRKIPKAKKLESEKVSSERNSLQNRLNINRDLGYGRWKLEMIGANENPNPGGQYFDEGYWLILPIRSKRKSILEYLAKEVLPKIFDGKEFIVRDTMIPCNGDCSWDCA